MSKPSDPTDLAPIPQSTKHSIASSRMMKVESLLNPKSEPEAQDSKIAFQPTAFIAPPTPALTSTTSASSLSPHIGTPEASFPAKRQKLVKDAPVFVRGEARGKVHYPPYESSEDTISLPPWLRDELIKQHKLFKIYPSGNENDGLIADFTRRIPYSSEKKEFFGKTGWEGFDVFQYTFTVPDDPAKKQHTVMWDYNTGFVRITPFFKACKFSKTTPAKALNANPGLREMSHSVTGGALVAQGYWMPYACARAVCLTFAYDIRWALTPIFGPSFIRECLRRDHPDFNRFRIDPETIRCSRMALQGEGMPRSAPQNHHHQHHPQQQPYVQQEYQNQQPEQHRQQRIRPTFKLGSPFDSEESEAASTTGSSGLMLQSALNSPAVSPKTMPFEASGWTSINQQHGRTNMQSAPPSPPPNSPYGSLDDSLLTEPPYAPWRPVQPNAGKPSSKAAGKRPRRHSPDESYSDSSVTSPSSSSRGSDDMDIDDRPPANRPAAGETTPPLKKTKKYTANDFHAARLLLELSQEAGEK